MAEMILNKEEKPPRSRDCRNNLFNGFRFLGINMPKTYRILYIFYSAIINGLITFFIPLSFTFSYIISASNMEMVSLLTSMQAAINVYACSVKFIIMGFGLRKLRIGELIMNKLDARCVDEDEKDHIHQLIKLGNRMVILYGAAYYSYTTSTMISGAFTRRPPYSLYIPFIDWRRSNYDFIITVITEYILVSLTCTQQLVDDSYASIYISILRAHVRILMLRISKLCTDPLKSKEQNTNDLVKCIIDHQNLLKLYNIFHPVISMTMFIQLFITAAILGITLINIVLFADTSNMIASSMYVAAVTVQSLPCCYYANCLMVDADKLAGVIFHSNWVVQDIKFRKLLVFFMQRSQKTMGITAGSILPVTMNSFLGITKFSFSLYTLLRGMDYGNKN